MTADQRISEVKKRISSLTDRIQKVVDLNEANKIVCYSDRLAKQIPKSQAAHSFNLLRESMFNYEILQILALWDTAKSNAMSIPAAITLIDNPKVLKKISLEVCKSYTESLSQKISIGNMNPWEEAIQRGDLKRRALRQALKTRHGLRNTIRQYRTIEEGHTFGVIKNMRDKFSHALINTRADERSEQKIRPMKYGEEAELLATSINCIENLDLFVNGTSFDIAGNCSEQARACAGEFWNNIKYDTPEHLR